MDKQYTANPEAYQLYLQGRFYWNKRTPDDFQKSIAFPTGYREGSALCVGVFRPC